MQESSVGPGMQLSGSDQHGMLNSLKADHRSNITQLCISKYPIMYVMT